MNGAAGGGGAPPPAAVAAVRVAGLKKLTRVPLLKDDDEYQDTHLCPKTLACLETGKSRTFTPLSKEILVVYCTCFKMKGDDDDAEGQMRFAAAMTQLSLEDRKEWEEENGVDLDVFASAMLKAIGILTDSDKFKRLHDICSDIGQSHSSDPAIAGLKGVAEDLTLAWSKEESMRKLVG